MREGWEVLALGLSVRIRVGGAVLCLVDRFYVAYRMYWLRFDRGQFPPSIILNLVHESGRPPDTLH